MAERFLPLYILSLGGTTLAVGFLNALDKFLSAIYSFPAGYLADKLGYKKSLIIFNLIAMFGYSIVMIFPVWQAVFTGAIFFIAQTTVSKPAIIGLITSSVNRNKHIMGIAISSFVRRIPMSAGPVLGGILITAFGTLKGIRIAFVFAFVLAGISLWLTRKYLTEKQKPRYLKNPFTAFRNIKGQLKILLITDIFTRCAQEIPYAFVVVWIVKNLGRSELSFGILSAVEMITAMFIFIPAAYFAEKYGKKKFISLTCLFYAAFPLMIYFSKSFMILGSAFIVRGLKELGDPARKALISELAPENAKASTFGAYYMIRNIVASLAAVAGAFLWTVSPSTAFFSASAMGISAFVIYNLFGREIHQPR